MLVIVVVSLYTSRVVLQTLGVEDFGIFNVVGGFVAMIAYLRNTFVDATQRFISFTLGQNDEEQLRKVFAMSFSVYLVLAIVVILVSETFGLWFINNKLEINPLRMTAANWVYQCSVISLVISMFSIPYNACIVAHEHMKLYAYISIAEAILKLLIVYFLVVSSFDKLILYSVLYVSISLLLFIWYSSYCKLHFEECKISVHMEKTLFKEMFSFSSWTMLGSLGFSFKDQFSNIIMNQFLGTTINAARGITTQVNGVITTFSDSVFTAISPQITKQYASGNITESKQLMYRGARFIFFVMMLLTIPIILNADFILKLWLGNYPTHTKEFLVIVLLTSAIYSMSKPQSVAIQATGNIKWFQISVCLIMLFELPIAWLILKLGFNPEWALLPAVFTNILAIIVRMFVLKRNVPDYDVSYFLVNICLRNCLLYIVAYVLCYIVSIYLPINIPGRIICIFSSALIILVIVAYGGLNTKERQTILQFIKCKINNENTGISSK